jgi:hypothetical protein
VEELMKQVNQQKTKNKLDTAIDCLLLVPCFSDFPVLKIKAMYSPETSDYMILHPRM